MESMLSKKNALAAMENDTVAPETRGQAAFLIALIEIREAIEEAAKRIDQTNIEAALMLVGCKESLDSFLAARLKADKVLAAVEVAAREPIEQKEAKPEPPEEKNGASPVTLDKGDFGLVGDGSGIT